MQTEDIRLEPDLYEACKSDIKSYCSTVQYGNAQVTLHFCVCVHMYVCIIYIIYIYIYV